MLSRTAPLRRAVPSTTFVGRLSGLSLGTTNFEERADA